VPFHPLKPQVQFLRRPRDKDEPVMRKGGRVVFPGGRRTEASRLQPHPPQAVARRDRPERDGLAPVQRPDRTAAFGLSLWHHLVPVPSPGEFAHALSHRRRYRSGTRNLTGRGSKAVVKTEGSARCATWAKGAPDWATRESMVAVQRA